MSDAPGESTDGPADGAQPDDTADEFKAKVEEFCAQFQQNQLDNGPAFSIAYRRLFSTVYRRAGNSARVRLFNTIGKSLKTSQRVEELVERLLGRLSAQDATRFRSLVHRVEKLPYEAADVRIDVGSVIEARETLNYPERYPAVTTWIEGLPQGAVLYDLVAGNGIRSVLAAVVVGVLLAILFSLSLSQTRRSPSSRSNRATRTSRLCARTCASTR